MLRNLLAFAGAQPVQGQLFNGLVRTSSQTGVGRMRARQPAGRRRYLLRLFAGAQPIQEHLFDGLVVRHQDMADGMAADEVADFFR